MINYNIMFPITSYEETRVMIKKGCIDFFGGLSLINIKALNDRKFKNANFGSINELNNTIKLINNNKGQFNLILNIFENNEGSKENIIKILGLLKGNFNLIIKDFELIDFINNNFNKKIHVSTIVGIMNYEGIEFLKRNFKNIKRICLERDINYYYLENIIYDSIKNNNIVEIEILAAAIGCGFSESSCKLHGIVNCSLLKISMLSMTGKSDCSYCSLYKLYNKFKNFNLNIILKISSRDRSFEERLEHYNGLSLFIKKLYKNDFFNNEEIFDFRNKNHNNDCKKILCGYF